MLYYLYGNEEYLINEEINKIIKNSSNYQVNIFNSSISLSELINQITSLSLFDSNKILIFKNCPFISNENKKEHEVIIESLNSKSKDIMIIFTTNKNVENNLTRYLKSNSIICKEYQQLNDKQIIEYVKNKIIQLEASISEIDLNYLLSQVPNNLQLIFNEIEKLVALDKNISRSNIDDIVQKYNINVAFEFINYFQKQDSENLFRIYYEKIEYGETIFSLISQITNLLENCSQIYSLKKAKFSLKDIEKTLGKHNFVIKKCLEFLNDVGYQKIMKYLKEISDIDSKSKQGLIDERIAFERFLLNIF